MQAVQAEETSYTSNPGHENKQLFLHAAQSTNNQLYKKRKHRQPVTLAAQAQAISYTISATQATSCTHGARYIRNASTGNQLYMQRQHRQPVTQKAPGIQTTQSQATSYTTSAITDKR